MKISVTDQFLWDIHHALEEVASGAKFVFQAKRSLYELANLTNPIFEKYRQEKSEKQFNWLVKYLKQHNYIKAKNVQGKEAIMLTKKGINKALMASFMADEKPKRKDGKWIMIIFDIPQKHQKARLLLRSILKNSGYKMFQQSVWVTPFDVSEKTEELLQHFNLDEYVKVFLIEPL